MAVVLDIEGTLCPISFVHDTLFPYSLQKARELIPQQSFPVSAERSELDAHLAAFPDSAKQSPTDLLAHIEDLTARDIKAPYLKSLQGYLWRSGYESGEIKAPLFGDVVGALNKWTDDHKKVYIYSSGSVPAQKLLFAHTTDGDLRPLISGYFDTTNAGPKMESGSYTKIAAEIGLSPGDLTFYSDNTREISAAIKAGWTAIWVQRPGNPPADRSYIPTTSVTSFA